MKLRALRSLTFFTSRGIVVIAKGETFEPANPQKLIDDGSAEQVTETEPDDFLKSLGMRRK